MRVKCMKLRDYFRWLQANGIEIRQGKGGEVVLTSSLRLAKVVIRACNREVGPKTILVTCKKFGLAEPQR